MNKESSKKIILIVFVIIVSIVVLVGFTYALFRYSRTSSTNNTIVAGKLEFGYVEETNGINLQNAMPISDETALNTTNSNDYFDFYVKYNISRNAIIDYEIDIENTTRELEQVISGGLSELSTSSIKVALENRTVVNNSNPMIVNPSYFSELEKLPASNGKKGYILHRTSISGDSVDYYRLYMWIPEVDKNGNILSMSDTGENSIANKAFSIRINVQALGKNKS